MSFNLSYTKEEIAHASRKDVELVTGDRKSKIRARNINRQRALLNVEIKKCSYALDGASVETSVIDAEEAATRY